MPGDCPIISTVIIYSGSGLLAGIPATLEAPQLS